MASSTLSRNGWFWGKRHPHTRLSETERLDLRASQRTFDGAYSRTALLQLSFSLTVMRLFQAEFFWVGLACCVLALGLFLSAVLRYRMTLHYEQKVYDVVGMNRNQANQDASQPSQLQDQDQAGLVVALTTTVTACVEVAIIVLVCIM